jgi:hypothetical protein
MVPAEGIEPPTFGLQNRCSTAELSRLRPACLAAKACTINGRIIPIQRDERTRAATSPRSSSSSARLLNFAGPKQCGPAILRVIQRTGINRQLANSWASMERSNSLQIVPLEGDGEDEQN